MKRIKGKRRAPRTVLECASIDVYQKNVQNQPELRGKICDISPLGVKFISHKPYIIGSMIYFALLLPSHGSLKGISGIVLSCEQKKSEEFHIAIEFKDIDYYQKLLIENYIKVMKSWNENIK